MQVQQINFCVFFLFISSSSSIFFVPKFQQAAHLCLPLPMVTCWAGTERIANTTTNDTSLVRVDFRFTELPSSSVGRLENGQVVCLAVSVSEDQGICTEALKGVIIIALGRGYMKALTDTGLNCLGYFSIHRNRQQESPILCEWVLSFLEKLSITPRSCSH